MEALKKNKILLSAFVLVFLLFISYFFIFNSSSSTIDTTVMTDEASAQFAAGQDILNMLHKITVLQIDNTLFTSVAWTTLRDSAASIPNDAPGKPNLFAPVGQGAGYVPQPVIATTTKKK